MAVLLLAAAASLGLAACSGSSTKGIGQLTVVGVVRVTPSHGSAHLVHTGYTFHAADMVQVVNGDAAIDLAPSGMVLMRPGTNLVLGPTLRLVVGDILVQPAGHTIKVATPEATLVVPSGAIQLAMPTAGNLGVKVYQSTANVEVAGSPPVAIAAPRQVVLTSQTQPPLQVVPLQYRDDDTWDRQYLAQAVEVSTQLAAAATGFNAQIPAADASDVAFYQALLPQLAGRADFVQAFDAVIQHQATPSAKSMAGDYLMASIIALRGARGSLQDRMNAELAFFAQGAPWGFVAYDQGVTNLSGVLSDVLGAIGRATLPSSGSSPQIALPPLSTTSPTTVPPATKTPTSTPTAIGPPVTTPTTVPATPTKPTGPTTTTVPPLIQLPVPIIGGPLGNVLDPLLDPIIQTLNNILAGKG
ncbi:MAG: hypothetical protein ACRDZ8_14585 [Acidimicrobiales bacterium]